MSNRRMITDEITWGETYDLQISVQDADGDPVTLDGTYEAACVVAREAGGPALVTVDLTIAGGVATGSIDTGDEPWKPGVYYYDVRITDPDGNDYWSETTELTLTARQTPASV